ncbi:HIRAN domain-containing protein [Gemmatimonas sp.]|uniref:HIRAN domain-containing protein n=1 Tax=Gemmatimonas sp. TaxID=1962908 RepID=UPI003561B3F9
MDVPIGPRGCPIAWTNLNQSAFDGFTVGPVILELRPEPDNKYNSEAIAVYLPNWAKVGYLPNWILDEYAKGFRQLTAEGSVVITGSLHQREGEWDAELSLMEPEYFYRWVAASPENRAAMPTRMFKLKLAGTSECRDVIADALGRSTAQKEVPVTIHSIPTSSGKYKGQPRLDFFHRDRKLGHLLPTRQDQIPDIFQAAADGGMEAAVLIEHSSSSNHRAFFFTQGRM